MKAQCLYLLSSKIMLDRLFGQKKIRILSADDDPQVRGLVAEVLGMEGYQVDSVVDGQEAIGRLRKGPPYDLVILDVHMPKLEGPQVLELIRLMPNCKDVGVIMLTSEAVTTTFTHAYELGVVNYIMKPFSAAKLLETVKTYLDTKKPQ